jgi:hypothetical protein|tara:strand:- start:178 stop:3291 length:3114 start_codon:yes stop_codon:yes gene_type:complete
MYDLSKKYNREEFLEFLKFFLPNDLFLKEEEYNDESKVDLFRKIYKLGEVKSLENLAILEVEHTSINDPRITLAKKTFSLFNKLSINKGLVIFYCTDSENYRISLVESSYKWKRDKVVSREFSQPRRLSFLLGPKAKIHTPTKQFVKLGKIKNFADLRDRFNIEIVNKEFFNNYKNLYLYLKKYLDEDKVFSSFAKKIKLKTSFFAQKLLGQIVFCYFLQKKGWLGVAENKSFGTGDHLFFRNQFNKYNETKKNFFNDFLEHFFYDGLNNENQNNYLKKIDCKVPYIGGGLFEYYDGYDWKKETLEIPNKTFSNKEKTGILDVFDLYNFTVDENLPIDIEIAIDPEMLGKVFENLLPENIKRKQGTFYTPREVVNYICESNLIDYLFSKLEGQINYDDIKNFVSDENFLLSNKKKFQSNALLLDKLLLNIKICDPAIGSGAFAVSVMNIIVKLRLKLKDYVAKKYKNSSYYYKKDCIQNCIYGVDIDETAVEISKLRLWLSLIVDESDYNKAEPLPNLDFKIIQGDSLIEEFEEINLGLNIFTKKNQNLDLFSNESEIINIVSNLATQQNLYFKTVSYSKKVNLKKQIENIMLDIISNITSREDFKNLKSTVLKEKFHKLFLTKNNRECFPWGIFFADVFLNNKGFDIIIGNPPYVDSEEMVRTEENLRDKYNKVYMSAKGNWDKFIIFIELGINLLNKNGILSFIVKNTLVSAKYSESIRRIMKEKNIKGIRDYSTVDVFKEADVYPVIFRLQNNNEKEKYVSMITMSSIEEIKTKNLIKSDTFYKNILWDYYFADEQYVKIISKMLKEKNLDDENICTILSACTVDEAYQMKKAIVEKKTPSKADFKFINSGTIDSYCSMWGIKKTQYIKNQYTYPTLNIKKIEKVSDVRAKMTLSEKLIIANMTRGLECFYDNKSRFCAGKSTTVILKGRGKYSLKLLCAVLNSRITNFFILVYFNSLKMSGGAINFGQEQIRSIPFPSKITKEKEITSIVDKILLKKNRDPNLDISQETNQIDQYIYKSYNLNQKEIELIEKF